VVRDAKTVDAEDYVVSCDEEHGVRPWWTLDGLTRILDEQSSGAQDFAARYVTCCPFLILYPVYNMSNHIFSRSAVSGKSSR
jgi:hypothetical protein